MVDGNSEEESQEDEYSFVEIEEGATKRAECISCGDPVKIVVHSGGKAMAAQHCKDCYAELRWGKIPRASRRRRSL